MTQTQETEKKFNIVATKKLERTEFEIEAEIAAGFLERLFKEVLKEISQTAEIAGFRAGKAPEHIVLNHFGEINILEKAARRALDEIYPELVAESRVRAIGVPAIAITKLARGNPLGFRARTATMPEIVLGDYKKIAGGVKRKMPENTAAGETANEEKQRASRDIRRGEIAEKILESAKFEVPDFFIESELEAMIKRFEYDVSRSGMTLDAYLTGVKKTLDDVRREWRPSAEKKARLELILAHIARTENILPDEERVKKEVEHIMQHHKDADRFQARQYIEHVLKNEAVFDFLEKQAD